MKMLRLVMWTLSTLACVFIPCAFAAGESDQENQKTDNKRKNQQADIMVLVNKEYSYWGRLASEWIILFDWSDKFLFSETIAVAKVNIFSSWHLGSRTVSDRSIWQIACIVRLSSVQVRWMLTSN